MHLNVMVRDADAGWIDGYDGRPGEWAMVQNIGNAPLTFQPFVYSNLLDGLPPSRMKRIARN